MSLTALFLAAAPMVASAPATAAAPRTVQVIEAKVSAQIVQPVQVRQATGIVENRNAPRPQVKRSGRSVRYEFE